MRKEVDIDTFVLRRTFGTITELITDSTGTIFIMLSISRKTMILLFFLYKCVISTSLASISYVQNHFLVHKRNDEYILLTGKGGKSSIALLIPTLQSANPKA